MRHQFETICKHIINDVQVQVSYANVDRWHVHGSPLFNLGVENMVRPDLIISIETDEKEAIRRVSENGSYQVQGRFI